jgi:hypothetical protein
VNEIGIINLRFYLLEKIVQPLHKCFILLGSTMVEKKIIDEAIELTNNIPSTDDVALEKFDSTE